MLLKLTPLFCCALTMIAVPVSGEQDQAFRRFLSGIAQKEARQQAKKFRLALNQSGFQGQLEMPNAEKTKVTIEDFQLKNDTITTSVDVQGDFRISGIWKREGQSINIKADVSARLCVTGLARIEKQNSDFYLAPKLVDCDFKILSISIQDPVELADGDAFLTEIANIAFQKNKTAIINQLNGSLTKYQIKF